MIIDTYPKQRQKSQEKQDLGDNGLFLSTILSNSTIQNIKKNHKVTSIVKSRKRKQPSLLPLKGGGMCSAKYTQHRAMFIKATCDFRGNNTLVFSFESATQVSKGTQNTQKEKYTEAHK